MKQLTKITLVVFTLLPLGVFANNARVTSLSVSSDGSYAVSANMDRHAYLWNLKDHTVKDLGSPYNIYSAYFVPDTNYYMLQKDDDNEVVINDVAGKQIYHFNPKMASYGQAISSDLSLYAVSDEKYNAYIYKPKEHLRRQLLVGWCMGDHSGKQYQGSDPAECSGFALTGKGMDFKFVENNKYLIGTTGYLYVFNLDNREWARYDTAGYAMNAISPDGKYVYTADQQFLGAKYDLVNNQLIQFPKNGKNPNNFWVNIANLEAKPVKENKTLGNSINQLTNFRFIDNNHYLATANSVPYPFMWVGLFDVNDIAYREYSDGFKFTTNNALKYIPLVKDPDTFTKGVYGNYKSPYPTTGGFNMTFDTSPTAHILVTAQANGDGIMVYQYHPDKQSLELVWSPSIGS